jgi:hypothetical protein
MFEIVNVSKLRLKVSIKKTSCSLKSGNTVAVTATLMLSLPEKSHSLLNGRFKLELSFRNRNTVLLMT